MALSTVLLASGLLAMAGAVIIGDMDQGEEFTLCVSIADWVSKTLSDDISLTYRDDTTGCCPAGTIPGGMASASSPGYQGAQIVCGFEDAGTIAFSDYPGYSCTYNKCYVMKQNIECADGSKQLLSGCCAATTGDDTGFPEGDNDAYGAGGCKNYHLTDDNVHNEEYSYCLTFARNWVGSSEDTATRLGYEGTSARTDDQVDGVLQVDKFYTYAACESSEVSGGGSSSDDDDSGGSTGTSVSSSPASAAAAPALFAALAVAQLA